MGYMFRGCSGLTTIYVSDSWSTDSVSISSGMFSSCNNIIGGNGTTYNSSYIDKTYARIDKAGAPGYFTAGTTTATVSSLLLDANGGTFEDGSTVMNLGEQTVEE